MLSFVGTDTVPAIQAAEFLYNANIEKELPEAAEYLPKIGIAVIVDTKSLRKKLA